METRSLAARSVAAVSLMVGFYALALGIVAVLLFLPYAEWTYAGRLHVQLAFACVLGAGAIAWSILPRPDAFAAPGPRLCPDTHPELFEKLRDVSRRTGQAMPREVYLVREMNAWVASRGGVMGFGSRRVMGLGLPLLQVMSAQELEAILAHEFGHYHGGDTRLGPWIYKTRAAIGRTLDSLGDEGLLHLPFRWYGGFFLRVTQAISRAQELTADRLAATAVGARPLIEGLKKVHGHAAAYDAYWDQEACPVLQAGFHAPLTDGFDRFLRAPRIEGALKASLAEELESGRGDPYDSHPPLRDRIRAVEDLARDTSRAPVADAERPALELLGDVDAGERALLDFLAGEPGRFQPLAWSEVTRQVFVPRWRAQAEELAAVVGDATLGKLPELLSSGSRELVRASLGHDEEIPEEYVGQVLAGPLGSCIAVALIDAGWSASAEVGEPVTVERSGTVIEPFAAVPRLWDPGEDPRWWSELLEQHAIAGLPLVRPAEKTREPGSAGPGPERPH